MSEYKESRNVDTALEKNVLEQGSEKRNADVFQEMFAEWTDFSVAYHKLAKHLGIFQETTRDQGDSLVWQRSNAVTNVLSEILVSLQKLGVVEFRDEENTGSQVRYRKAYSWKETWGRNEPWGRHYGVVDLQNMKDFVLRSENSTCWLEDSADNFAGFFYRRHPIGTFGNEQMIEETVCLYKPMKDVHGQMLNNGIIWGGPGARMETPGSLWMDCCKAGFHSMVLDDERQLLIDTAALTFKGSTRPWTNE